MQIASEAAYRIIEVVLQRSANKACDEGRLKDEAREKRGNGVHGVVVVCFHDRKCCLSSQVKAASCAWCSSEMPPSKQVNGYSFTIRLIVWCSPQSQSDEAM